MLRKARRLTSHTPTNYTQCLLAALLTLASIAITPKAVAVEGAFGIRFDTQLTTEQLGASIEPALLTSLFIDQTEIEPQRSIDSWRVFAPKTLPVRLRDSHSQMYVQLSASNTPTWITASFGSKDCNADLTWLLDVLKKKYDQPDLSVKQVPSSPSLSDNFTGRLLFEFKDVVVAAGCTAQAPAASRLQIEYWNRAVASDLQLEQQEHDDTEKNRARERAQAAKILGETRGRAVASTVASGTRYSIEQVFGIPVKSTVKMPGNFVVDEFVDYPLHGVAAPYRGKTARVQLGPTGHLIRVELKIEDAQAAEFERLQIALEQIFSQPTKATRKHVIFTVGADYLILRRRLEQLEFTLISGAGEKGLKSRKLAAQEAQWQAENVGI